MPKISDDQREARRKQILDSALECFSENGFHQTGMADIVGRSGLSHGAVYLYFSSKDEIIEALADDRHRREAVLNSVAQQRDHPIKAIQSLIREYARALTDPAGELQRRVGVNGWAEALRNERVRSRVVEGIDAPRSLITELVRSAQVKGQLARDVNAEALARSLIALFQGFVLQAAWGEKVDVASCVAVIDRMLGGLKPTRSRSTRRRRRRNGNVLS